MKKYSETHEWVRIEGKQATIGITQHAQKELGDIVYVELPEVDKEIKKGDEVVILESTKAAADVYTPVGGKVLSVNSALTDSIDSLNTSPEREGWLFTIEISSLEDLNPLLDEQQYQEMIGKD
ncbi:Glycine cleavage system H protein [Chlamydiales bacterium SCGC AB-751-O23]|jgi:glycine cleavage system H protein|nr:Glycine cleavage system H protein [Chlamydiales bacterium SCGC AB-751-O23]